MAARTGVRVDPGKPVVEAERPTSNWQHARVALSAYGRQPIAGRQRGRAKALGSGMQDDPDWPEAATILAHDPRFSEGAVVPPVYQTSLFTFESYQQMRATFAGRTGQAVYSRVGNPTTAVFEDKLARLEGAEAARGFASGMAAISGAVLSQVQSGDRRRLRPPRLPRRLPLLRGAAAAHGRARRLCRRPRPGRRGQRPGRAPACSIWRARPAGCSRSRTWRG